MAQIDVMKYWYILSALRVPEILIRSILAISFVSFRILLILDSIYGQLRSTKRL